MSSRISYMDLVRSTCREECSKTLIYSYKSQHDYSKNAFPWQFTHMLIYVCACPPMLSSVYIVVVSNVSVFSLVHVVIIITERAR